MDISVFHSRQHFILLATPVCIYKCTYPGHCFQYEGFQWTLIMSQQQKHNRGSHVISLIVDNLLNDSTWKPALSSRSYSPRSLASRWRKTNQTFAFTPPFTKCSQSWSMKSLRYDKRSHSTHSIHVDIPLGGWY